MVCFCVFFCECACDVCLFNVFALCGCAVVRFVFCVCCACVCSFVLLRVVSDSWCDVVWCVG